jgi:hypothetical protein
VAVAVLASLTGADRQLARTVNIGLHGFDPVHDKVDQHLLELDPIAANLGQAGRQLHSHRHGICSELAPNEGYHLPDNLIDVERNHLDFGLLRERPNPADHLASPIGVLDNPFHGTSRSIQIGRVATEPADTGVRIGDHGGKRLVDFVGYRGGEFAERRDACDMGELGLRFA